jgi:hypothetical protein
LACVLLLAACGGEDGADGMAEEVGGSCVFTPGEYVATYEVTDASSTCGDIDPLPNEYLTVTDDGTLVGTSEGAAPGCVDGEPTVRGCFVAFNRVCTQDTVEGRLEATVGAQFWYDDGEGQVTLTARLYSGATLLDSCTVSMDATVERR